MSTQSDMSVGKTLKPFTLPEAALSAAPLLWPLWYYVHMDACQMGLCQEMHFSINIVGTDTYVSLRNAFHSLEWPPAEATFHARHLPKTHSAFGLLHTCMLHKHEITYSARLTGKLGPEATASVRKCFFDPHTHTSRVTPRSAKKVIKAPLCSTLALQRTYSFLCLQACPTVQLGASR